MSKSMAIEGVMKIFLMVAVIIVGMSFLMKAFGIDLFEWLKEQFGGFGVPNDGRILVIKMDPEEGRNKLEVFAFHLTNQQNYFVERHFHKVFPLQAVYESYFMPKFLQDKKCVIYTIDEDDDWPIRNFDEGFIYYIESGVTIQKKCGNKLADCIYDGVKPKGEFNCVEEGTNDGGTCSIDPTWRVNLAKCPKPTNNEFAFVNCGCEGKADCDDDKVVSERKVEQEQFSSVNQKTVEGKEDCKDPPTTKCNLLEFIESNKGDNKVLYEVKYGLLCDNKGNWQVCKKGRPDPDITITTTKENYHCTWTGEQGTWGKVSA